jgi:hypothetical protein
MKEIGSYFGLEQLLSNEYYKDLILLNNGIKALLYLLEARNIKQLYILYYLTNTVSDMCSRNDYIFGYYKINTEFIFIFNKTLDEELNRIELGVLESNTRALKLYEKIRFKRKGVKPQSIYKNGKFVDMIMMVILKEEFCK